MTKTFTALLSAPLILAAGLAMAQSGTPATPAAGKSPGHMKLDKDGDGAMSREEFLAGSADHFRQMDANGDGRLTLEEFQKRPMEMFTAMDTNRDGKVTREERKAYKEHARKDKRGKEGWESDRSGG